MKDNATMFFMLAIVSAVAFTGIGTCLAMGNKGLTEMINPFAFTYTSLGENPQEGEHITKIKKQLTRSNFSYQVAVTNPKFTENNLVLIKVSEYNKFAKIFGYEMEKIDNDQEAIIVPSIISQKKSMQEEKIYPRK